MPQWEDAPDTGPKWEDAPTSMLSRAVAPIKNVPKDIGEEFSAGGRQIKDADAEYRAAIREGRTPSLTSPLKMVTGGLQEAFSPITGTAKAIVGDPLGNVTRDLTGSDTAGDFMRNLGTDAASLVGPGAVNKAMVNAADALPKLSPAVRKLLDAGVPLTPGMIYKAIAKGFENWASEMPVLRDLIQNGQRQSIEGFNRVIIDKTLEPLGVRLPKDVKPGREAIAWAEDKIGRAYDAVLPKVTFRLDGEFLADSAALRAKAATLPEATQKQLAAIGDNATSRLNSQGAMNGKLYKQIDSELATQARGYLTSADPDQRRLGMMVNDFRGMMMDAIERGNPGYADKLRDLNSAWAAFSRAADASILHARSGGIFSPNDLLTTVKNASTKGAFRRGEGLLQDIAEAAADVLPSSIPENMGVVGKGTITGILGGPLKIEPSLAAAIAAGTGVYTKPGMRAVNALAGRAPGASPVFTDAASRAAGPIAATSAAINGLEGGHTRRPGRPAHATTVPLDDAAEYVAGDQ